MASTNYSAKKYLSPFKGDADVEMNEKKWDMNQIQMNQSLNEFMKSFQKSSKRSLAEANLDITNLDEDDVAYENKLQYKAGNSSNLDINNKSNLSNNEDLLDGNSTTAEFRKYLNDLKRNYLEKLTFSCPSKLTESKANMNNSKGVENNCNDYGSLNSAQANSNIRRSLYFGNKMENLDEDKPLKIKPSFTAFKSDTLDKNDIGTHIKLDKILEAPELTKSQILSRLVQIREYLKQSYTMLSTLQESNDLINYSTQMNKLHSLIEHLKEQEKGYMDLLKSFSKFQNITSNLYSMETKENASPDSNHFQKDILDLSELNESLNNQQKQQKNQHNEILVNHANYLNDIIKNSTSLSSLCTQKPLADTMTRSMSNNRSIAMQTMPLSEFTSKQQKLESDETDEASQANSISGSFISDTLTLNGVKVDINNLLKYKNMNNRPDDVDNLMVIGKSLGHLSNDNEDNKTENDLDLNEDDNAEFNYDVNPEEIFGNFAAKNDEPNIQEQRKEIFNALDSDLQTLEQLKEQKNLLKSIRLRKEELKALEGRRLALEALRKIANESEVELDRVLVDKNSNFNAVDSSINFENASAGEESSKVAENKLQQVSDLCRFLEMLKDKQAERNSNEINKAEEENKNSSGPKQYLTRKTFKQTEEMNDSEDESDRSINENEITEGKIEPSSQIEKSKQTVKHFEELIRNKKKANEISSTNVLKPISALSSDDSDDGIIKKELSVNENIDLELSFKMKSLADNEKKLDDLYSMQSRLSQLKELISNFDETSTKDTIEVTKKNNQNVMENVSDDLNIQTNEQRVSFKDMMKDQQTNHKSVTSTNNSTLFEIRKEFEQIKKNYEVEKSDSNDNQADLNKEEMLDQKIKLANAKEKLKQLQEIIGKLKGASSQPDLTPKQQNELEQKEAAAALEILNDIEKQKQHQRLEELKRNKQKLLELLRQKENESAQLAKLYSSYSEANVKKDEVKTKPTIPTAEPIDLDNETIENKFESAENDFEILSNGGIPFQNESFQHNSPSDLLWSQMKKQLNMRENLRNKKQELEDLIRHENKPVAMISNAKNSRIESTRSSSIESNLDEVTTEKNLYKDNYENTEDNKIMNCYRDFLLKNKHSFSDPTSQSEKKNQKFKDGDTGTSSAEEDEEEIIMKRYIPNINPKSVDLNEKSFNSKNELLFKKNQQQQNICSTDELIEENKEIESLNNDCQLQSLDNDNVFSKYKPNELKFTHDVLNQNKLDDKFDLKAFTDQVTEKFSNLVVSQQKLSDSMQKNFTDLFEMHKKTLQNHDARTTFDNRFQLPEMNNFQTNMSAQFQFQMQVQQMMFNMSSIQSELNTHRSDVSQLKEQYNRMNTKLNDFKDFEQKKLLVKRPKLSRYTPPNVNLPISEDYEENSMGSMAKRPTKITTNNALPSYFYRRQQQNEEYTQRSEALNQLNKYAESLYNNTHSSLAKRSAELKNDYLNDYEDDFEDCEDDDANSTIQPTTTSSAKAAQNGNKSKKFANERSSSSSRSTIHSNDYRSTKDSDSSGKYRNFDAREDYLNNNSNSEYDGELISFDQMREKIYAEVANLISQNETRPFYLIHLFKELQYLKEKNARDQVLKSIFNIANRQTCQINSEKNKQSSKKIVPDTISSENCKKISNKNSEKEDDDDSITCKYRMKKFNSMNKSSKGLKNPRRSVTSDSNFETDEKQQSSLSSRSPSPENDSLSNTVIFVKSSPQKQLEQIPQTSYSQTSPKRNEDFSRSSSSSILGIQDTYLQKNFLTKAPKSKADFFEENNVQTNIDQKKIELEVKNLISKIIKMIKSSGDHELEDDDFEYDEDAESDSDDEILEDLESKEISLSTKSETISSYKNAKCDSDYLNEIIDKVISVLKESNEYYDYLRLYQSQLTSYLKDALIKYENKRLIKCMEDILIDISDILYNELTFYAIMNSSNCIKRLESSSKLLQSSKLNPITETNTERNSLNLIKSLAEGKKNSDLDEKKKLIDNKLDQLKQEFEFIKNQSMNKNYENAAISRISLARILTDASSKTSRSTSLSSANTETKDSINSEVYYFDENDEKTKLDYTSRELQNSKIESNYADILSRLKLILNEKTEELNNMMALSDALKAKNEEKEAEFHAIDSQDEDVMFHSPLEKDDTFANQFKMKMLKYSIEKEEADQQQSDETDTDAYTDADSDRDQSVQTTGKPTVFLEMKSNDEKENIKLNEITIDDLPSKMSLVMETIEASTSELNLSTKILDKIILESISDGFVGDADVLPDSIKIQENNINENMVKEDDKNKEYEEENKSDSSTSSDNYVLLSSTSSDHVVIDNPSKDIESEAVTKSIDKPGTIINTTIAELKSNDCETTSETFV